MAEHKKFGYEKKDVHLPAIVRNIVGLFILLIASIVAMKLLFDVLKKERATADSRLPVPPMLRANQAPPEPRLEVREGEVVDAVRAYEQPLLTRYEWVDEKAGIARIPVERAMELVVKQKSETP
jgi:hypothetical protein